jgi:DNA transformation protein
MCIAIVASDGVMYFKVDDGNAAMFDRENCAPFTYPRGGKLQSLYSYRRMPERLYDDPEELALWARGSFSAALNQATEDREEGRQEGCGFGEKEARIQAESQKEKGRQTAAAIGSFVAP